MYRGDLLLPGARDVYQRLSANGVKWVFLSNNASKLPSDLAEDLNKLGIPVGEEQVLNSGAALIYGITAERPDAKVLVVGEDKLIRGLERAGIELTDSPETASLVVAAMDRGITYDKITRAQNAILNGADFWATNTDASFPDRDGIRPGAGSIVAAIAAAAKHQPDRVFGKPFGDMASAALAVLGLDAESCVVVGDRMETDILFAHNAGIDSVLVLTGATARDQIATFEYRPDYVCDSVADLDRELSFG